MKRIPYQSNELAIMAEHGEKADPRTDDPARLEILANWHWLQLRPRPAQVHSRVHWALVRLDRRRH